MILSMINVVACPDATTQFWPSNPVAGEPGDVAKADS